jgi:hypothetical protein
MAQQNQLKIHPTRNECAPHPDRWQPPSSNLRGANKRLIATFANSKNHVSQEEQRASYFSNRNKNALSEFDGPNSSPELQPPLEFLIVSQKRLEIALTRSKQTSVAFSNRHKIHEVPPHTLRQSSVVIARRVPFNACARMGLLA